MSRARLLGIAVLVVVLCAGFGLSVVMAQSGDEAASQIGLNRPEYEPNDSIWNANGADLGQLWHGALRPAGDVDFYRYYAQQGMPLAVTIDMPAGSPLVPVLSLYDWNEQLLAQATCAGPGVCLSFNAAESTDYFLSIADANGGGGQAYRYSLVMDVVDVYEPNDFMEQAAPVAYGDALWAMFAPAGDVDFFSFEGMAGEQIVVNISTGYVQLFDADDNEVWPVWNGNYAAYTLPATGTYYIQAYADYCSHCPYVMSVDLLDVPLYLSLDSKGSVGGVAFTSGDILRHWMQSGTWEMFFDASDMGLKGNLVAIDFGQTLNLVYDKKQNVANVGSVTPSDVLSFWPYSYGEDTFGYLDWMIDGSDVGLTTSGEGIDALAHEYYSWYDLILSPSGTARVPYGAGELRADKDDVLSLYLSYVGANTAGLWNPFYGGFALDAGAANLWGLDKQGDDLYLVFDRRVTLDGVVLDPGDIARCRVVWYMAGCETVAKYFDASDAGLGGYKIDAFDVGDPMTGYPYP